MRVTARSSFRRARLMARTALHWATVPLRFAAVLIHLTTR